MLLGLVLLAPGCPATAADAPSPAADPCPRAAMGDIRAASAAIQQMMTPGAKFDYTSLPVAATLSAEAERQKRDFPNLCQFRDANAKVVASGTRPKVVFLGDSITALWQVADPGFFSPTMINRGIGGQTTPQIELRFYPDVVALHPRIVHIIAGTNDVAEITGPASDATIVNNIRAMIDIAQANGIKVVLGSTPPTKSFYGSPIRPAPRVKALNAQLSQLAREKKVVWVDYYAKLTDPEGGMLAAYSNDGVHPNRDGYAVMRLLAEQAIARATR